MIVPPSTVNLPFKTSNHSYTGQSGIHMKDANNHKGCTGSEGALITHKNKSLDKYIYPMYVLQGYTISQINKSGTYRHRNDGEAYDTNTHTTEYDKDDTTKRQKVIDLPSNCLSGKGGNDGYIPDLEMKFTYSMILVEQEGL